MLIANCEKTQRTTGRRGRHGQQANSLLRVMAPSHRPSGNPGLFGRKFGNDDQCPGAENSHAGRSDPNAVTEGSRMDCRIEFSVPHDGRKREIEGVYPTASIFRQRQHPSGHRQSRLQQEQTGCCKLVDAPSRPISGSGRLGIRHDAPRHAVIAMGSRQISCYVLWHPTAPVKMQRFSVAKLGNDGKDSGAENLYASRPDPNSVSEGSRLGC